MHVSCVGLLLLFFFYPVGTSATFNQLTPRAPSERGCQVLLSLLLFIKYYQFFWSCIFYSDFADIWLWKIVQRCYGVFGTWYESYTVLGFKIRLPFVSWIWINVNLSILIEYESAGVVSDRRGSFVIRFRYPRLSTLFLLLSYWFFVLVALSLPTIHSKTCTRQFLFFLHVFNRSRCIFLSGGSSVRPSFAQVPYFGGYYCCLRCRKQLSRCISQLIKSCHQPQLLRLMVDSFLFVSHLDWDWFTV